jgi:hypothetical protein
MNTFTLLIETTVGNCHQYGFHLRTDEKLARQIAKEKFQARRKQDLLVVSVALTRLGRMIDRYDGDWGRRYNQSIFASA